MNYQGWFDTTTEGKILLKYSTGNSDEERQQNFIIAAAEVEVKTDICILVNEEGRRLINAEKDKMPQQSRLL